MNAQEEMSTFEILKTRSLPDGSYVDLFTIKGTVQTQHMVFSHHDREGINNFRQEKLEFGDSFDSIV